MTLDPDSEFWPNLDPKPGLCYTFEKKKKIKIALVQNSFLFLNISLKTTE